MTDKCPKCGAKMWHFFQVLVVALGLREKPAGGVPPMHRPGEKECLERQLAAANQAREKAEARVAWAGDLGKDRIEKGEILAERDEARTQLSAWHTEFGTTQLTHAVAERDRLVKRVLEQGEETKP